MPPDPGHDREAGRSAAANGRPPELPLQPDTDEGAHALTLTRSLVDRTTHARGRH